jgi:hypothetical protein
MNEASRSAPQRAGRYTAEPEMLATTSLKPAAPSPTPAMPPKNVIVGEIRSIKPDR